MKKPIRSGKKGPLDLHTLPPFPPRRPLLNRNLRIWRGVLDLSPQEWQALKAVRVETFPTDDPARAFLPHAVAFAQRCSSLQEAQQYAKCQLELFSSVLHQRYLQGDRSALSELIAAESSNSPWILTDQWYKAAILRELRRALPPKKRYRPSQPGGRVQSNRDAVSRHRAVARWIKKYETFCYELKDPKEAKKRILSHFQKYARITDLERKEVIRQELRKAIDKLANAKG
jgi:hypothetical protein